MRLIVEPTLEDSSACVASARGHVTKDGGEDQPHLVLAFYMRLAGAPIFEPATGTHPIAVHYGPCVQQEPRLQGVRQRGGWIEVCVPDWRRSLGTAPSLPLALADFLSNDVAACRDVLARLTPLTQSPGSPGSQDAQEWYRDFLKMRCCSDLAQAMVQGMALWQRRPSRLETLYHLAKVCRGPFPAFAHLLLATTHAQTQPEDLYVEPNVYTYLARYEASIVAFYGGDKALGFRLTDELLLENWDPELRDPELRDSLRKNLPYYTPNLAVETGRTLVYPALPPHNFLLNPGLCVWRNELIVNVRMQNITADWRVHDTETRQWVGVSSKHWVQTTNLRLHMPCDPGQLRDQLREPCELRDQLREPRELRDQLREPRELRDQLREPCELLRESWRLFVPGRLPPMHGGTYRGLEDCRLFVHRDRVWFTATSQEFHPDHISQMCLGNDEEVRVLQGPDPLRYEKNWLAFSQDDRILAIYSYQPLTLLELHLDGTTRPHLQVQLPVEASGWRGSAGPLRLGTSLFVVVHEVLPNRLYVHRFLRFDSNWRLTHLSRPFRLQGEHNVEYIAGLAQWQDRVYVSWGCNDESAKLSSLSLDALERIVSVAV
jgi:hypothetical protein